MIWHTIPNDLIERAADKILCAAGSGLRHYTMTKTREDILAATREAIAEAYAQAIPKKLKSPTCGNCARDAGFMPITNVFTTYIDVCRNCRKKTFVSNYRLWKRPGEKTTHWHWD